LNSTISITSEAPAIPFVGAVVKPKPPARYTQNGDAGLESHLAKVCQLVGEGVRGIVPAFVLEGVLLGGGYGRGEGGVLPTENGDAPYNDMEFYVFISGSTLLNDRLFKKALHHLGEKLSETAGIEVEFKILSLSSLRLSRVNMFTYDFVMGHRWVLGNDDLLTPCGQHRKASAIPRYEAARLLFNRFTGLLYSRERLLRSEFTTEDADFVARNLAKARLALGDAILASAGQYHWSCLERHRRLASGTLTIASDMAAIVKHHAAGVEFKLHPRRSTSTRSELAADHLELCELARRLWLTLESTRLGRRFASLDHYRLSGVNKCPEHPKWRNWLVNLRHSGVQTLLAPSASRYPRERLFHALSVLLWGDLKEASTVQAAQQELHTQEATFPGLVRAYQILWSNFN